MKKIFNILCVTIFSLFLSTSCQSQTDIGEEVPPEEERVEERTLTFYALNDFHGAYLYDEDYEQTGISRIGNYLIDKKTSDPENTFILSSGDMFQGGAETNITYGSVLIETMNLIGFDSMTIGNHEFDWGTEVLEQMTEQMDFPLLGINVFNSDQVTKPSFLHDSTIVSREGIKVGIIGAIEQGIESSILATIADDYYYPSAISLIREEATRLREEGCEVVVLSTHDGEVDRYQDLIDCIDAIFLGHDHYRREGFLDLENERVPYVEAGSNGNYLSEIKLRLELDEDNKYQVVGCNAANYSTFSNSTFSQESEAVNAVYEKYREEIEAIRDRVLYNFDQSVSRSNFGKYVSYALLNYASYYDPQILCSAGSINSGGIRSNIASGEFTYGDLIKVYPFENVLCVLQVEEANYRSLLNNLENVVRSSNEQMVDGYYYIATIDYVAFKASTKAQVNNIIGTNIACRDLVAEYLLNEGYSQV